MNPKATNSKNYQNSTEFDNIYENIRARRASGACFTC
jgi:hypothetical protein